MQDVPPKLLKKISHLSPEEQQERIKLFKQLEISARIEEIQSPRFWAMRQVLAERSEKEIKRKLDKRSRDMKSKNKGPKPDQIPED
jgi:hypothetical protein